MPQTNSESTQAWLTDFAATVLLGLAAVASGWAAYQSARWSGLQTFSLETANVSQYRAGVLHNSALQFRAVHVGLLQQYVAAIFQKDTRFANFLYERFPPPLRKATDAWLAMNPFKNANAPPSPFAMEEYKLPEEEDAARATERAEEARRQAHVANQWSDRYVLAIVPFAVVSLFAGLSPKFRLPVFRTAVVLMALAIFIAAAAVLASFPVR